MTDKEIICLIFGFGLGVIVGLGGASFILIAHSLKRMPPNQKPSKES
jgi:hypothetical protein